MAKSISPGNLGKVLEQELGLYHENVTEKINAASERAVKSLVKKTKATAPKQSGEFAKNISSKRLEKGPNGDTFVWFVKPPHHRITHLLVHGHAKVNGGRVAGDPFLENALSEVLPEYEKEVKEALE